MKKDILIIAALALLLCILISGTEFQSVEEYYLVHIDDITPDSETVFISISCKSVLDNYSLLDDNLRDEKYVPSDGVILEKSEYVLRPGDTAFSVLQRTLRHNKIQMEYQGADENSYGSVYVQGINYLYEFSCGARSGWMYKVNGLFPNVGCSDYVLQNGDVIEWVYTCSMGLDIGKQGLTDF